MRRTTDQRARFYDTVGDLLPIHPDLAVVLADIGVGAIPGAGDRVINVGIREQGMIGVAAGLALAGYRPIAHSYTPFVIERPFEQIKLDFAHQGLHGILVSVGGSHDWPQGGRTHQAPEDVALMATLPGWAIHLPGHADEVEAFVRHEAGDDGSAYIRLSGRSNRQAHAAADGRLAVVRPPWNGAPVVLAIGPMLDPVLEATAGLDVGVAYAATVRPIDAEGLRAVVGGTDVVIVEPVLSGTLAPAVSAALSDRPIRLLSIGVGHGELRKYGSAEHHDRAWGLDAPRLRTRIAEFVRPVRHTDRLVEIR